MDRYTIILDNRAEQGFGRFDKSVQMKIIKVFRQLETNPEKGKPLGHKMGTNLTGFRKIYVDNKRVRIVYVIKDKQLIVKVVAVGKRDKGEVYLSLK